MKTYAKKVLLSERPFQKYWDAVPAFGRGRWPARWLMLPGSAPAVWGVRLRFEVLEESTFRIHVSADERYELLLDGERVGRGPERGGREKWYYESYDIVLEPGSHVFFARVWALAKMGPVAQMSIAPGFLLVSEDSDWQSVLGTGDAPWEVARMDNYRLTFTDVVDFDLPPEYWATGSRFDISAPICSGSGAGDDTLSWQLAKRGAVAVDGLEGRYFDTYHDHPLAPAELPAMFDAAFCGGQVRHVSDVASHETARIPFSDKDHKTQEREVWQNWLDGHGSVTVPAGARRRVLIDWKDYVCGYSKITLSGGKGGLVRLHWTEGLYRGFESREKLHRDEVSDGFLGNSYRSLQGVGSTFRPDGKPESVFSTLWWEAGRYVELYVEAGDLPLTLEKFVLEETRYPFDNEATFASSDERLARIIPIAARAWQMCSHETYIDCPFYEQLMYGGDSRVTCLLTYVLSSDHRLPHKAVKLFADSLMPSGLTQAKYPSSQKQVIPSFSLWWIGMLHDYTLWRGSVEELKPLLPTARLIVETFAACRTKNGLVLAPKGWNFVDWTEGWPAGEPLTADAKASGVLNWQVVIAYRQIAELEKMIGENELSARSLRKANELSAALSEALWSGERGLFAEDESHTQFSEHSQCLALIAQGVSAPQKAQILQGLREGQSSLLKTSIYFSHYLFEAFRILEAPEEVFARLPFWQTLVDQGFRTTFESENATTTRSDCHAWGAHPLFHFYATILGIRPAAVGFSKVLIEPQIAHLTSVQGEISHPLGRVKVAVSRRNELTRVDVELPVKVTGILRFFGNSYMLAGGNQVIELEEKVNA